jgi:hypothetical protein
MDTPKVGAWFTKMNLANINHLNEYFSSVQIDLALGEKTMIL